MYLNGRPRKIANLGQIQRAIDVGYTYTERIVSRAIAAGTVKRIARGLFALVPADEDENYDLECPGCGLEYPWDTACGCGQDELDEIEDTTGLTAENIRPARSQR